LGHRESLQGYGESGSRTVGPEYRRWGEWYAGASVGYRAAGVQS
jgi:hypothetical protein